MSDEGRERRARGPQPLDRVDVEDDVHQNHDVAPDGCILTRVDSFDQEIGREIKIPYDGMQAIPLLR